LAEKHEYTIHGFTGLEKLLIIGSSINCMLQYWQRSNSIQPLEAKIALLYDYGDAGELTTNAAQWRAFAYRELKEMV